ncbi:MAG: hypothetical protein WDA71_02600 [Actinomycetota bacterium]
MSADPDRLLRSATWLLVSFFGLLAGSALLMPARALVGPQYFFTAIALAVVIASRLLGPVAATFNGLLAGLFYNFFFDKPYGVLHLAHWSGADPVLTLMGLGAFSWAFRKAWHLRRALAHPGQPLTVHVVGVPTARAATPDSRPMTPPHPVSLHRIPRAVPHRECGRRGWGVQSPLEEPASSDASPERPSAKGTQEGAGPWPT